MDSIAYWRKSWKYWLAIRADLFCSIGLIIVRMTLLGLNVVLIHCRDRRLAEGMTSVSRALQWVEDVA